MSTQSNAAPIIIKRRRIVKGEGHHGGAWKVAYADFVTAMMTFFLLMWLLNATTEKQRKGIADYFNPMIPINRISGGGDGAFGGSSVFSQESMTHDGTGGLALKPTAELQARGETGTLSAEKERETATFESLEGLLRSSAGDSASRELLLRHIVTRVTDEGLIVEVFDRAGASLFLGEGAEPTPLLRELVGVVAKVFDTATNSVAVNGHVRSYPVVLNDNPVWPLSTQRAGVVRGLLEADGFPAARLQRVTGFADRKPTTDDRGDLRNNRIEMILLRSRT